MKVLNENKYHHQLIRTNRISYAIQYIFLISRLRESPQDEKGHSAAGSHSPVHRRLQKLEQFHQTFCEIREALHITNEPIPPQQLNEFSRSCSAGASSERGSADPYSTEFDYRRSAGEVYGS